MNFVLRLKIFIFLLLVLFYLFWGIKFITQTSFVAIDGNRYYSLLDDAMISMRYAWNLSHGYGLVWNPGEYVEGYSNLLMTLVMSVFTLVFDKNLAVFGVQIFGLPIVLGSAFVAKSIFSNLYDKESDIASYCVFLLVLFYYPLSYWSLMGMETGLLLLVFSMGVLYALRYLDDQGKSQLWKMSLFFGLAFLARNETIIYSGITLLYIFGLSIYKPETQKIKDIAIAGIFLGLFVVCQTTFRGIYYGELLPNTYYLKVGIPLLIRLNDGIIYSGSFLQENWVLILLALLSILLLPNSKRLYLLFIFLTAGAYQIWTGGDAWERWRFMIPVIPFAMILALGFIAGFVRIINKQIQDEFFLHMESGLQAGIILLFTFLLGYLLASPYWSEIKFDTNIPDVAHNQHNVNIAVALNQTLIDGASIGVFWAGAMPYYTNHRAIDFLGKSDAHIARLYPHLPKKFAWLKRITVPGHNKYDLNYSIKELQPVYIQRHYWGEQNLRRYVAENYVHLEYQGKSGTITLTLKKDSPYVLWEKGTIKKFGNK